MLLNEYVKYIKKKKGRKKRSREDKKEKIYTSKVKIKNLSK